MSFDSIKPSVVAAERQFLIPLIGKELYAELNTAANGSPVDGTSAQSALLAVVRQALAPFILFLYAPKADASITDGGVRRAETTTSKTAYQYQLKNLRAQLKADADLNAEYLLEYLEDHKEDFSSWTGSETFKKYRRLFIQTGGQFNQYFSTASPYRNYMAMRATMYAVEEQIIKKLLGSDFYAALKAKAITATPAFTDEENELLEKLKYFVANTTIIKALPSLSISLDERGITIYSEVGRASGDDDAKRGVATPAQIDHLLKATKEAAEGWLEDIKTYLADTASETVFAEYYAWQQEVNPDPEEFDYDPECGNSTYGMF